MKDYPFTRTRLLKEKRERNWGALSFVDQKYVHEKSYRLCLKILLPVRSRKVPPPYCFCLHVSRPIIKSLLPYVALYASSYCPSLVKGLRVGILKQCQYTKRRIDPVVISSSHQAWLRTR